MPDNLKLSTDCMTSLRTRVGPTVMVLRVLILKSCAQYLLSGRASWWSDYRCRQSAIICRQNDDSRTLFSNQNVPEVVDAHTFSVVLITGRSTFLVSFPLVLFSFPVFPSVFTLPTLPFPVRFRSALLRYK
jgi:hypothetical protein